MNRSWLSLTLTAALFSGGRAEAQSRTMEFQVGDRILLLVEGDSALSDTFTVVAGPALQLPAVGQISLAGVRRADIETYLARELARYVKNPIVRVRALIRISVLGEVTRPGFYAVPLDLVLADALMVAGGPTQKARVDRLRILRGGSALWSGNKLQLAIGRGATLDDLGLRGGDRIDVPAGGGDPEAKWRLAAFLVTSVAAVVTVITLTSRK